MVYYFPYAKILSEKEFKGFFLATKEGSICTICPGLLSLGLTSEKEYLQSVADLLIRNGY